MLEPTFRPLITIIRLTPDRSLVEVSLDLEGRVATGYGEIVDNDSLVAACRGTIHAVQGLLPDRMRIDLDWCQRLVRADPEPDVINSAVTLTIAGASSPGGGARNRPGGEPLPPEAGAGRAMRQEHLIGAAFVRHDADVAAVRATLDGLSRRLAVHMFEQGDPTG